MRGREEAALSATVVADGNGREGRLGARSWSHPLIRDIPIMDARLKGRQVREFDSRIRSADTFDLRACLAFLDSFQRQPPRI